MGVSGKVAGHVAPFSGSVYLLSPSLRHDSNDQTQVDMCIPRMEARHSSTRRLVAPTQGAHARQLSFLPCCYRFTVTGVLLCSPRVASVAVVDKMQDAFEPCLLCTSSVVR